jgi:hypothetical protein
MLNKEQEEDTKARQTLCHQMQNIIPSQATQEKLREEYKHWTD